MSKTTILRPLTSGEVRTIAIALATSIARDGDKVARTGGDLTHLYNNLRTASGALAAVTDYACNRKRQVSDRTNATGGVGLGETSGQDG